MIFMLTKFSCYWFLACPLMVSSELLCQLFPNILLVLDTLFHLYSTQSGNSILIWFVIIMGMEIFIPTLPSDLALWYAFQAFEIKGWLFDEGIFIAARLICIPIGLNSPCSFLNASSCNYPQGIIIIYL